MLKFKTSCAVLAYLSSNLLNEVGLSLFRYFEVGLRVCDIVVKKFTFAISSPDEFLLTIVQTDVLCYVKQLDARKQKKQKKLGSKIEVRPTALYCVTTLIRVRHRPLTFDLDLQSHTSYGHEPHT